MRPGRSRLNAIRGNGRPYHPPSERTPEPGPTMRRSMPPPLNHIQYLLSEYLIGFTYENM